MALIHDISMPINQDMPVYKNKEEKKPKIQETKSNEVRESRISLDSHAGTHIDAPSHMLEDGHGIEKFRDFIHKAAVIDLMHIRGGIRKEHLEGQEVLPGTFVLLKTKNSFDN